MNSSNILKFLASINENLSIINSRIDDIETQINDINDGYSNLSSIGPLITENTEIINQNATNISGNTNVVRGNSIDITAMEANVAKNFIDWKYEWFKYKKNYTDIGKIHTGYNAHLHPIVNTVTTNQLSSQEQLSPKPT